MDQPGPCNCAPSRLFTEHIAAAGAALAAVVVVVAVAQNTLDIVPLALRQNDTRPFV